MARLNSMLIGVEILLYGIAWETVFISFVYYASLSHIRIGKRVFPAVTVQKVAAAPHAQAAAKAMTRVCKPSMALVKGSSGFTMVGLRFMYRSMSKVFSLSEAVRYL